MSVRAWKHELSWIRLQKSKSISISHLKWTKVLMESIGPVCMIPLSRGEMRGGIILMYWNKLRLMIQQNITIFLGADYTILGNQRILKQQQQSCSTTRCSSQHFSLFTSGENFHYWAWRLISVHLNHPNLYLVLPKWDHKNRPLACFSNSIW